MTNTIVKWQIIARDPEKTARFYSSLFHWKIDANNKLGYRELKTGNGIDGGVWPSPAEGPDMVQLFIEVDDVDATIAAAQRLGATIVVPKSTLPDGDTMAILLDPAGISFGIMSASTVASTRSAARG
jgi:predicted enzyme related to lactoylglutathione lyase